MKIGIMSAWNTTSGVAMHAEPIGKALKKMGHEIKVFTFLQNDEHGEGPTAKNEKYVVSCFGTRPQTNSLDPRPLLEEDYEILLVEDLGMLPAEKLANIMPVIKKKAKVMHVVHENKMCQHSWFYQIDWDKVIYFDKRQEFLKTTYPDAEYIPFPCFPIRSGNKIAARKKLKLPLDKKIIYVFGHRGYHSYYRDLPPKLKRKAILLHVINTDYQMLEELTPADWRIVVKKDLLTTQEFDDYLFASDAALLHKFQSRFHAVVSSTVFQALGAGCPIFVPKQSDFFHSWDKEVIHYRDITALNKKLIDFFGSKEKRETLKEEAEKFVEKHSPERIAQKFLNIFEKMLSCR
ncbi:MAG: glycosyltransferase [Candidatus Omnitrophota bacterium]